MGFHVSHVTWDPARVLQGLAYRTITLYGEPFQVLLLPIDNLTSRSRYLHHRSGGFRLFPFRSPLLGESLSFSFPRVTKMFQFSRYRLTDLCIQSVISTHYGRRVAPFGHLRIKACLRLPGAFRSLPRPSSPSRA